MSQTETRPKILIVDDSATDIRILFTELGADYEVFAATSGEEALKRVASNLPDLILLDVAMPGMDGHDVCRALKADMTTCDIPVIFITAKGEEGDEAAGFALGAADYIAKPYCLAVVRARVASFLKLKREMDMREALSGELMLLNEKLEDKVEEQVAQLRDAHEKVKSSEQLMRLILGNIMDPVFITDDDGRFSYICTNVERILGYSNEELQAMGGIATLVGANLFSPEELDAKGEIQNIESTIVDKHGHARIYLITVKRVAIMDGTILWTCRDIDARKQLENRLRQAYKMEAMGTLAGGIAHDFNNILSAIAGYTEISKAIVEPGSPVSGYLTQVLNASGRAKDLVNQILMFSRETEEELKPISIALPIKEALRLIRASVPATVDIRSDVESDAVAMADPTQIHQVVMNLCTNAAHAMREKGGVLDVRLAEITIPAGRPTDRPELMPGAYIKLSVSDTGHGIPAQIRDRIFDPFFTTKDKGEGTGMGLSVVHGIVKGHGGSITVHSEPAEGSTFEIWIPALQKFSQSNQDQERPIPVGTESILFVDDETMIVDIGTRMLESLGYHVVARTSAVEALEVFNNSPDKFDLVVADMIMPNMTGLDLAGKIHRVRPDIPIALCTGFGTNISEQKAMSQGLRNIIFKPILRRDMANAVRKALDER